MKTYHDVGVSKHLGTYSDAVEVGPNHRWLFTAGTPGLDAEGKLPEGIEAQTEQMWANVSKVLDKAGMSFRDIVKVNTSLVNGDDIAAYAKIRARVLNGHKPAFMLSVIPQLVRPGILVEVEIVAARAE